MCWTSDTVPIKQIASKDIIVYKTLANGKSVWYNYLYTLGKLEILPKDLEVVNYGNRLAIHEGFHSFILDATFPSEFTDIKLTYKGKCVAALLLTTENLYQCIIPKGSIYYVNEDGFYVSNQIIINKAADHKVLDKYCHKVTQFDSIVNKLFK